MRKLETPKIEGHGHKSLGNDNDRASQIKIRSLGNQESSMDSIRESTSSQRECRVEPVEMNFDGHRTRSLWTLKAV